MIEYRPLHHYVVKIASKCNLNCTYCHIYNHNDKGWKRQPTFISLATFTKFCERVLEHCKHYNKNTVNFVFHGGEPLLGGEELISGLSDIVHNILIENNVKVDLSLQSNGLLFTEKIGECLRKYKISLGISIDGPPEINDIHRINHQGKGTSFILEERIAFISSNYNDVFSGFLTVVNPLSDPLKVTAYLLSFNPAGIDFLLPHHNYDNRPLGKDVNLQKTLYGDWLITAFDYWFNANSKTSIRFFESIIRLLLGGQTLVETVGNPNVDVAVIECNGEIELDDNLRSTYDGITRLGYDVFSNSINDIMDSFQMRRIGRESLCEKCQVCPIVEICGGGNLPHRYAEKNQFDNPSVYCKDLEKLIRHIEKSIRVG